MSDQYPAEPSQTVIEVGPFNGKDIAEQFRDHVRQTLRGMIFTRRLANLPAGTSTETMAGFSCSIASSLGSTTRAPESPIEYKLEFRVPPTIQDVDVHNVITVLQREDAFRTLSLAVVTTPAAHASQTRGIEIPLVGPATA